MKRKKTRIELANSFFLNCAEISRLFELSKAVTTKVFGKAQALDKQELKDNYLDSEKVRLTSVLQVLGITAEELERKIGHETDIQR